MTNTPYNDSILDMLSLILSLLFCFPANATIAINTIDGYSNIEGFIAGSTQSTAIKIYGGLSGSMSAGGVNGVNSCSSASGTAPCDNCDVPIGTTCNRRRVYNGLVLKITFTSTTTGIPIVGVQDTDNNSNLFIQVNNSDPNVIVNAGTQVTVNVPWSTICQELDGSTCSNESYNDAADNESLSRQFKVGIRVGSGDLFDSDDDEASFEIRLQKQIGDPTIAGGGLLGAGSSEANASTGGMTSYTLFPGDGKAFIEEEVLQPINTGEAIRFVHTFCTSEDAGDFDHQNITVNDFCSDPILVNNGNQLSLNTVEGLTNDTEFYFLTGVEDKAGNIGLYSSLPANCLAPVLSEGCQTITPQQVSGLFAEDTNCFIATAAYGSPFTNEVKTLRKFRDKYLKTNRLGRAFVEFYYSTSPKLANWIAKSASRRAITRWFLAPLFFLARAANRLSPFEFFSFALGLGAVLLGLLIYYRRREV